MSLNEAALEKLTDKRFRLRQDYLALKSLSKPSGFRRGLAATLDLYIGLMFVISNPDFLPTWGQYAFLGVYFVFRDSLFRNASIGKIVFGLRSYDHQTLTPAKIKQSLIRGTIYSTLCVVLCLATFSFAVAAASVLLIPFGVLGLFVLFNHFDFLSILGYNHEDGRTIPDDWAGTHILQPKDVDLIRDYEKQLSKLSTEIKVLKES